MRRPLGWPHVILLSCAVMTVLTLVDAGGTVPFVASLWFLLVCPGMAFAPLLPHVSRPARLGLAIALSLAADTAVATTLLALEVFSSEGALFALQFVCLTGCALQVWRDERRGPLTEIRLYEAAARTGRPA